MPSFKEFGMKAVFVIVSFSISVAAQMTNADLLKLDRDFAQETSKKRLDGWMNYIMQSTVIFGPPNSTQRVARKEEIGLATRICLRCQREPEPIKFGNSNQERFSLESHRNSPFLWHANANWSLVRGGWLDGF
jgi:hypothetical protein